VQKMNNIDGKQYDVMVTNVFEGQSSFVFNEKIITGLQKLVQRFIIILLTMLGSKVFNEKDGTFFLSLTKGNNVINKHYINISIMQATQKIKDTSLDAPLEEQLESVEVLSFYKEKDEAFIEMMITNKLGDSQSFDVPINI
jgi:hypothetical protein